MNLESAARRFFQHHSTFEIRWKKSVLKDWISPGMFESEFLKEFTKKQLREMILLDLVMRTTYTDPRSGVRRAAIVYKALLCPQVSRFKKVAHRFYDWETLVPLLIVLGIFFLMLVILTLFPRKSAFGFARTPAKPPVVTEKLPSSISSGYFDSKTEVGNAVRCFWVTNQSGLALSCVR